MPTMMHRFGRFAVVGALATGTHTAVLAFGIEILKLDPVLATAIAFFVATLVGYTLNRRWTFVVHDSPTMRLRRYTMAASVGLVLNVVIMYVIVHLLHGSPYVGLLLSIVIVPPVTFSLNQFWVFREHHPRR